MINDGTLWLIFVLSIVAGAVGLAVLYAVIRAAVLSALREHTVSSTTAVSLVSAVPLKLASAELLDAPSQP